MKFAQPQFAWFFWVAFALMLFLFWVLRNKKIMLENFSERRLLTEIISGVNSRRQAFKQILIILALVFSILALMRPQWGFQWQEVKRKGLDILIAVDTSKSMLASDVAPNRLERSKLAVRDLINKLKGDRVGLIAFSGSAFLQCPLTVDYEGFLLALDDLKAGIIPQPGTSISSAIRVAFKSFEGGMKQYKNLIIITDGEDHQGDISAIAQEAKKQNIKIFTIGIGTREGELIQLTSESGEKSFLKDSEGNLVKSRLNENILQEIASVTGGSYVRSSGAEFGLDLIYGQTLSKLEKREIKSEMTKLYHERFQIPLAIAFLLLLLEPLIGDKRHDK